MQRNTPNLARATGSASFEDLGRALAYPLQPAALTSIAAFALALVLGSLPVVGMAISLFIWAGAYRYAIEVLERSASGAAEAPEYAMDVQAGGGVAMLVLQLSYIALILVVALWTENWSIRIAWWLLLAFFQPAATMNLVLIGNAGGALNPVRWLQLIARVGFGYFLLVLVGVLATVVQVGASAGLAAVLPEWISRVLGGFVAMFLLVFNFHLMGRIVWGRRAEIGHDMVDVPQRLDPSDRHVGFMREMEIMIAEGQGKQAAAAIRRHLETEPYTTPAMHQRYRRLLEQLGDHDALAVHTQVWVSRLLGDRHEREALLALGGMLQRDPGFRIADVEQRARLARAAINTGMPDVALSLSGDFHVAHPKSAIVPEMALLGARLLVDRNSDTRAARAALHFAAERFPDHPLQQEILLKIEQIDALEARLSPPPR